MKEVNVILPYEILDPIGRENILALHCVVCGMLTRDFWQSPTRLSTDEVSAYHMFVNGSEHQSYLQDTGKRFVPHKKKFTESRCV